MRRLAVTLGLMSALSACMLTPVSRDADGPAGWVELANAVRAYDADELDAQYRLADERYRTEPTSAAAITLALLVSDPRMPFHDPERAIVLLDGVAANPSAPAADGEFGRFMRHYVAALAALESALAQSREEAQSLDNRLDSLIELERRLNQESAE